MPPAGKPREAAAALGEAFDGLLATDDRFIALRVGIDLVVLHDRLGASDRAHGLLSKLMALGRGGQHAELRARPRAAHRADPLEGPRRRRIRCPSAPRCVSSTGCSTNCAIASQPANPALARPPDDLTARERSIVEFIARGRSNKEIARELGVAPETIKTHLKRIFQKLSAESRAQAVVRAQSLGMLKTNGHHAAL